jgi:hypothetical protein
MCDYSLKTVASRAAEVGDKLITKNFGTGTVGFAGISDPNTAVCVLPGTEIAFDEVASHSFPMFEGQRYDKVARFRQINLSAENTHHDALEFPSGHTVLLNLLAIGQTATVLQLPAKPKTEAEAQAQKRLEVVG